MGRLSNSSSAFSSARGRLKRQAQDLNSSGGLLNVANNAGGNVADAANQIANPHPSLIGRVGNVLKTGLMKTLDILQRPNYAVATAVKNVVDKNPDTGFFQGLGTGITGQTKNTFHDVFTEAGWNPQSKVGKVAKGLTGFAADVLLDPTTYLTFGVGSGAKVGEETLSKAGTEFLGKALAQKSAAAIGKDAVQQAIVKMAKNSPQLYGKFLDQGGIKYFGKTLISSGRIAGVAHAIPGMTKLDELTAPTRNTIYALFHRDASAKFGKLPQEYTDLANKFRDLGYVRSQGAVDKALNIAAANSLNSQEAELITNAIEHKLPLADLRLENARKQIEQVLGRNLKNEQRAGIAVGELPNYVPHILVDEPVRLTNFKPEGVRVSLGASKARKIEGSISEINSAFGKEFFDPNVIKATAIRSVASERAVTAKEFLTEVGKKFGAKAEEAPSNYVKVAAKELEGMKFHPAIAESIDTMKKAFISDEPTTKLLEQFDKLQNAWKASVTQIFPAFHGRNAMSNVFLNYLDIGKDALNPTKHYLAADLLNKNRIVSTLEQKALGLGPEAENAKTALAHLLDQPILTDKLGKTWSFGELRDAIKNSRVAFSGENFGGADLGSTIASKLEQTTKLTKVKKVAQAINPLSTENLAFKAGRKVGNTIEEQARLVNFLTNLQKTGDVLNSANRTKQFLFDYQNLAPFEKNVLRRLIPFYTFTRKNLELQFTQLLKQPGKYATQAKVFHTIGDIIGGAQLSEDEQKNLPAFLKQGLGIVVGRNGSKVQLLNNLGTPIEQVFNALQKNQILGSLSPAIAIPLQIATQRNFFYDKPLDDVNDASAFKNAPDFIKEYIGFTVRKNKDGSERYIALNPTRLFIVSNLPPNARVISSIRQLEQNNVSGKLKVLQQLTGIKPYGTDTEINATSQEKQKTQQLQDLLDTAGVAPIFKRSFIPKN